MKKIALILALLAANQSLHAAQSPAIVLERYLDAETTVVIHLRVEGLLFEPTWAALRGVLPDSEEMPAETPVQPWIDALARSGVREIFGILSLTDASLDIRQVPVFFVVPAGSGAPVDEKLLGETLQAAMPGGVLRRIGENWVFAQEAHLDYVATLQPAPRPELDAAFAVVDPQAQLRVAWIPSAAFRKALRELMPELPRELGGGSGAALSGLVWAGASVRLAPEARLQGVIQSTDPAGAQAAAELLANLRREIGKEPDVQESFPAFEALTARLMPTVEGSRLIAQFDQKTILEMLGSLAPMLGEARQSARKVACMNNLKQIGLALMMYANDNKDQLPPESGAAGLRLIIPYLGAATQVLVCPAAAQTPAVAGAELTEANVSYAYLGGLSLKELKDPGTVPLAFDKPGNHDGFAQVVFADGHVATIQGAFATGAALIEHLSTVHNYPPELRAALLEKVKLLPDRPD